MTVNDLLNSKLEKWIVPKLSFNIEGLAVDYYINYEEPEPNVRIYLDEDKRFSKSDSLLKEIYFKDYL